MKYDEYRTYLRSAGWQCKKREAWQIHTKRCAICNKRRTQMHHLSYKALGDENVKRHLLPLCGTHHKGLHDFAKANGLNIWEASQRYIKQERRPMPRTWRKMNKSERKRFLNELPKGL